MGGKTVLADAQFGTARILRPFEGFQTVYEGVSVQRPIMLTEVVDPPAGGQALDPAAQVKAPGYDPRLVSGITVPFGSRLVLWLPAIPAPTLESAGVRYQWMIMWRLRNTYDYRNYRIPYHYPKQSEGVPDTTPGNAGPRVVIPAAWQTLPYSESPQPTNATDVVTTALRTEFVSTGAAPGQGPLLPSGGGGVIQQGIANPFVTPGATQPLYQVHEVQAVGDEFLIGLTRGTDSGTYPTWAFTSTNVDENLALLLGSQYSDLGVYAFTGSAP